MTILAEDIIYDKKEQLEKIEDFCLADETVRAVFDLKGAASGFLAVTDKRLIFYDKAFLRSQKAMVSLPYSRISIVASEDNRGFVRRGFLSTNKLTVMGPGFDEQTFEFRGPDKAHQAHRMIVEYMLNA